MNKVLSQEEIDALFSAMSSEDLNLGGKPEKGPAARKIANYDFLRADRIPQDQMRSMRSLHEGFGRSFASSLSAYLRACVEVNLSSVEQIPYSAFIQALPDPTLFAGIGVRSLDGKMALELNPSLAFPLIDMILGGPGRSLARNRTLTEIELNVIEGVLTLALRDLSGAWRPVVELDLFLEDKGTRAQMLQTAAPAEVVIAVRFELKAGENSGMMNLCIPVRMVKQLRARFEQQCNARRLQPSGGEAERIFELMKPVPMSLSCEFRNSSVTMDDLLKVSVGDTIDLNEPSGDPVYLCVGGIAKFAGRMIQRRGKKAFEIFGRLSS